MLTYNLLRALSFWCFFLVLSGLPVSVPPDITQRLMREGALLCESLKSLGLAGNLATAPVMPAPPHLSPFTIHDSLPPHLGMNEELRWCYKIKTIF